MVIGSEPYAAELKSRHFEPLRHGSQEATCGCCDINRDGHAPGLAFGVDACNDHVPGVPVRLRAPP
jgi:hypothetical protein